MKESAIKRKSGYIYAGISFLFALCLGALLRLGGKGARLSLEVRSGLELTGAILFFVSLILAVIAIRKGPKWLGYIVFIFAFLVFVFAPTCFYEHR